jgi:hypothetical protein
MRMPVDEWAGEAVRGYKRIARSTKAPAGDMASLLAQLQGTVGKWAGGQGKDLYSAFHTLLDDAGVSNANFGGQKGLQKLGLTGNFNLTNPAVLGNLKSTIMYSTKLLDATTNNLIGQALVTGASAGLDMDKTASLVKQMVGEKWTDLSHGRARTIATTEVCRATSYASRETYYKNGIGEMEWWTAMDDKCCPSCEDMHGQKTGTSGGGNAFHSTRPPRGKKGKGITAAYPPAHPDCRCTLEPVIPDHWTRPVQPWTGGKRGGPADQWSAKVQDVLAHTLMRTSDCKIGYKGTSLDSQESWDNEPNHGHMAAYYGHDGQVHIGPDASADLRALLEGLKPGENPDWLIGRYETSFKTLVHENIHAFNPIAQSDYLMATGKAMEEGLTESLALNLWKEVAEKGFGVDFGGSRTVPWRSYEGEVQTVNLLSMAASATGDLGAADYLVRWKTGVDPSVSTRLSAICEDVLRGMGYSADEVARYVQADRARALAPEESLMNQIRETITGVATIDDLATWIGKRWHTALEVAPVAPPAAEPAPAAEGELVAEPLPPASLPDEVLKAIVDMPKDFPTKEAAVKYGKELRRKFSDSLNFDVVDAAIQARTASLAQGGVYADFVGEIERYLKTGKTDPMYLFGNKTDVTPHVQVLLDAINRAPVVDRVYRGVAVDETLEQLQALYASGRSIDLSMASTTFDRSTAGHYAQDYTGHKSFVVFEIHNAHALPIEALANWMIGRVQNEALVSGHFKVLGIHEETGTGKIIISIEQTGSFS